MRRGAHLFLALTTIVVASCELRPTEPPPDPLPEPQPQPEPEPEPEPEPPVEPPVQPPPEPPTPEPPTPAPADTVSAVSFNIFHDASSEMLRIGPWESRRDLVLQTIVEADADIVGLQEAYMWQVAWLVAELPKYSHVGRGRDADGGGESVAILFETDRFMVEESGHFWLSPTPDAPGSTGGDLWGGMTVPRIVTWARLGFVESERELYVYNTHLPSNESGGSEARRRGVTLLAERIAQRDRPDVPFVLLGDLNSTEDSFPVRYLKREARGDDDRPSPIDVVDTWRQVNAGREGTRCRNDAAGAPIVHGDRVDYVFVMDTTRTDGSGAGWSTADGVLASTAMTPTTSCGSDHVGVLSRFVVP
jgi:endonuclease/exonuclease/phosphatase family metal-dependent hydrolase